MESERATLAEERRQWQAEREACNGAARQDAERRQQQIEAQSAEFELQRTALTAERNSLGAERAALAEERRQWESRRLELPAQTQSAPQTELTSRSSEESPAATPEPPSTPQPLFEEPAKQPPVDLSEVLRRIGAKLELSEEEATTATASTPMQALRASVNSPADSADQAPQPLRALSAATEDEESIDDYMSRLMQRVCPGSGEADGPSKAAQRPAATRAARQPTTVPTAVEPPQPAAATSPPPSQPEPVNVRLRTPPRHIELSVFRELANLSARHAIQLHSRRALVHAMYGKLTVSCVALVASVGLFWMWKEFRACRLTLYSSLVAIVVAIFWGLEYALLTGRLIVNQAGHVNINWKSPSRCPPTPPRPPPPPTRPPKAAAIPPSRRSSRAV